MGRYSAHSRRRFIAASAGLLPFGVVRASEPAAGPLAGLAPLVEQYLRTKWAGPEQLYDFLTRLPDGERLNVMKALELVAADADAAALQGKVRDVPKILDQIIWLSRHTLAYPFTSHADIDYHAIVAWVASEVGVRQAMINAGSTFALEYQILHKIFPSLWEKLDKNERVLLLSECDPGRLIPDDRVRDAIAVGTAESAIKALHHVGLLRGFRFYTAISRAMSSIARRLSLQVALRAAGRAAGRGMAILSGPVGWAIGLAAEAYFLGKPNPQKTGAFIIQMHMLRVAAMLDAGVSEAKIFTPSVEYPGSGRLEANRPLAREWETFKYVVNTDGTYSFAAYSGYLAAERGGGGVAVANRDDAQAWERWSLERHADGKMSLRTASGYYLSVEVGGSRVVANRRIVREWERFTVTFDQGRGTCTIRTWENRYVSAQLE